MTELEMVLLSVTVGLTVMLVFVLNITYSGIKDLKRRILNLRDKCDDTYFRAGETRAFSKETRDIVRRISERQLQEREEKQELRRLKSKHKEGLKILEKSQCFQNIEANYATWCKGLGTKRLEQAKIIDNAIEQLFKKGKIEIRDRSSGCQLENHRTIANRIETRLNMEHGLKCLEDYMVMTNIEKCCVTLL